MPSCHAAGAREIYLNPHLWGRTRQEPTAAQAARLAPGADFSAKVLSIGEDFTAALSSFAPSFHSIDLLVGVAGAVLIRLIVYFKGKNAKKYRKNVEYGSARWSA